MYHNSYGTHSAVSTTDDGSTYTNSGWGINVVDGTVGIFKMNWVLFWVLAKHMEVGAKKVRI